MLINYIPKTLMYLNKTPYSSTMGHSLQGGAEGDDAVKALTHS